MARSTKGTSGSAWRLQADLLSTRALLWVAGAGRVGEPTPEAHRYLSDRYWRLAEHYDRQGGERKAARYRAKAREHHERSGADDPPFAAAMALPPPRPPLFTRAVARRDDDSDDAA